MRHFAVALAPHLPPRNSVRRMMGLVLLALLPGIAAQAWYFGAGVLAQIALATIFALAFEAATLRLRGAPWRPVLSDLSATVTAVLFALCLPASAPWWLAAVGMLAAVVVAKQMPGGLGQNRFNPAMVGLAVASVCFPHEFIQWLPPSGPTREVAIAYALGGMFLLWTRVISWQVPVAVLGTVCALSLPLWLFTPGQPPLPPQQVFPGSLMLAACFIANDPVTGCITPRGRMLFGIGVGAMIWAIRRWTIFPDGVAFAVLSMNCAAPWLDSFTRPRLHGGRWPQ
jgi:electron transport complex protein RnfD